MAIKSRPSFDPKSFLAKVGEGRSIGCYSKDQIVYSQGDPADAVFYLQKGKVKIAVVSEQGKEAIVAMLGTNDFFGEGCLAGQARRMAAVTAMTECVIARLEKAAILRVIHEEPAFSEMFIAHLLGPAGLWPHSSPLAGKAPSRSRGARRILPRRALFLSALVGKIDRTPHSYSLSPATVPRFEG